MNRHMPRRKARRPENKRRDKHKYRWMYDPETVERVLGPIRDARDRREREAREFAEMVASED